MPAKISLAVLKDYGHVLGSLTRTSTAALDPAVYAVPGIAVRDIVSGVAVTIPAAMLEMKDVDLNEELLLRPRNYVFKGLPDPEQVADEVTDITLSTLSVGLSFTALPAGVTAKYFIQVESDSLSEPAVFEGQTAPAASNLALAGTFTSGSPHKVFAAVEGRRSRVEMITP